MRAFARTVLGLVLVTEVAAAVAAGFAGASLAGVAGGVVGPVLVVVAWVLLPLPKAPGPTATLRFWARIAVLVACGTGLVVTGRLGLGIALAGLGAVVNGVARLPEVRALLPTTTSWV